MNKKRLDRTDTDKYSFWGVVPQYYLHLICDTNYTQYFIWKIVQFLLETDS